MHATRYAGLLLGLSFTLAGCAQGWSTIWQGIGGPTPAPSFWYEANPAEISYVAGPATATLGQPVVLSARVIIGSSSCDRFKELQARVDESSRSLVLSGIRESKRSDQPLECTSDLGSKLATVSVTLPTAGVYRVTAERFLATTFAIDEPPRATIDIAVTGN